MFNSSKFSLPQTLTTASDHATTIPIPPSRPIPFRFVSRAGDGNRTHVACLEGRYSTIELHPPWLGSVFDGFARRRQPIQTDFSGKSGRAGGRRGVSNHPSVDRFKSLKSLVSRSRLHWAEWVEQDSNLRRHCHQIYSLAPLATWVSTRFIEGRYERLRDRDDFVPDHSDPIRSNPAGLPDRAGGESRTHNRRFTKPVLCQLSYASDSRAVKFRKYTVEGVGRKGNFPLSPEFPRWNAAAPGRSSSLCPGQVR